MFSLKTRLIAAALLIINGSVAAPVVADDTPAAPESAPGSAPGSAAFDPHLQPLARFVGGEWRMDSTGPDGQRLKAREVHEWTLDGRAIRSRTYVTRPDGSEYQRYEILNAWDSKAQKIVYRSVSFNGAMTQGEIVAAAPDLLEYPPAPDVDGHPSTIRQTIAFADADTLQWTVFQKQEDGGEKVVLEGAWHRTPASSAVVASHDASHGSHNATRIEAETIVKASIADAWKCWSTSEGAQSFFAPRCRIQPHPGGAFEIWFMPDAPAGQRGAEDLKVLSVVPGEMISFEWNAPPQFAHARPLRTWVVVTLHPIDDSHTRVRLVHLGWDEMKAEHPDHAAEWDQVRSYFEAAWPKVLGWMTQRFEKGPRFDANGTMLWKE